MEIEKYDNMICIINYIQHHTTHKLYMASG